MKGNVEQGWVNRAKVIRTAIRLKHSLAADNELNRVLDEERKKYHAAVLKGRLPEPLDTAKVLDA